MERFILFCVQYYYTQGGISDIQGSFPIYGQAVTRAKELHSEKTYQDAIGQQFTTRTFDEYQILDCVTGDIFISYKDPGEFKLVEPDKV
jgi:hypothetical protein